MDVDGNECDIVLKDNEITINGRKYDTGNYSNITLDAAKDYLIVTVVKTWNRVSFRKFRKYER